MRLTHAVTITIEGRDDLTIEYDPEDTLPIAISQDPDGEDRKVLLSYEQYDVLADLIWAHRPDPVVDAAIKCGQALATTNTSFLECALNDGHANPRDEDAGPNPAGGYHVTSDGTLFAVPALPS